MNIKPDMISGLLQEAVAAHQAGRIDDAEKAYRDVLAQRPGNADALNLLGVIAADRGATREAVALFDRALRTNPQFAAAHFNRGNALVSAGDFQQAQFAFKKSIKINPLVAEAWLNLGALQHRLGLAGDAVATFRELVRHCPDDARGRFNLGRCLIEQKNAAEAVSHLERALQAAPDNADYHQAFAEACADLGDTSRAIMHFKRAHALAPDNAKILTNLGTTLADAGDATAALAAYEKALAVDPHNASARTNRGMTRLALGQLAAGWDDYAARHNDPEFTAKRPRKALPPWAGEELVGRTILVSGEQGLGDEILYGSMLPDLIARGAAVTFECDQRLVTAFRRSMPSLSVRMTRPDVDGVFDYATSLIDLGQWLRPAMASFKNRRAYLIADPARALAERTRWQDEERWKVGISWRSSNPTMGDAKSLPLSVWAPLLAHPKTRCVDLQYGRDVDAAPQLYRDDLDLTNDIEGVAARISALDLVVTVSNTVAHLAGSLGVPTIVLVPRRRGRLWYWFDEGSHSPWYPSVRVLRFDTHDDAAQTIADLATGLKRHA